MWCHAKIEPCEQATNVELKRRILSKLYFRIPYSFSGILTNGALNQSYTCTQFKPFRKLQSRGSHHNPLHIASYTTFNVALYDRRDLPLSRHIYLTIRQRDTPHNIITISSRPSRTPHHRHPHAFSAFLQCGESGDALVHSRQPEPA